MEENGGLNNTEMSPPETNDTQSASFQQPVVTTTQTPFADSSPHKKEKRLVPTLALLLVMTLIAAGYLAYQNYQLKKQQSSSPQTIPTLTSTSIPPTTDWQTLDLSNSKGYSIKFPNDWSYDTKADEDPNTTSFAVTIYKTNCFPETTISCANLLVYTDSPTNSNDYDPPFIIDASNLTNQKEQKVISDEMILLNNQKARKIVYLKSFEDAQVLSEIHVINFGDKKHTLAYSEQGKELLPKDKSEWKYENTYNQILSTFKLTPKDSTSDWQNYSNTSTGFSIKYPPTWRTAESASQVGFGPKDIGVDTAWAVVIYNKSEKTVPQIKDDIGDQFPDRQQTSEDISFGGLTATKVITTTNQYPEWYSVYIIIEGENTIYGISNGAQKDQDVSFEDFYTSFELTN